MKARNTRSLLGLIGYPITSTLSKDFYTRKIRESGVNALYENFEMKSLDQLLEFIEVHPNLRGFNLTIPHKETIFRFLDDIATAAREIGAVNTVVIGDDGYLHGYNTDYIGFRDSLMEWIPDEVSRALVLGTGGAAKAVCYTLSEMGIEM